MTNCIGLRKAGIASAIFALGAAALVAASPTHAQDKSIVVASTTSTQDSGLFGHILPLFKAKTGIDVKVIAQGTGEAGVCPHPVQGAARCEVHLRAWRSWFGLPARLSA